MEQEVKGEGEVDRKSYYRADDSKCDFQISSHLVLNKFIRVTYRLILLKISASPINEFRIHRGLNSRKKEEEFSHFFNHIQTSTADTVFVLVASP